MTDEHFCAFLLERGWNIVSVTRPPQPSEELTQFSLF